MNQSLQNKLHELLQALSAGEATLQQARRLDQLLKDDREARACYLDFMATEAELHAQHSFDRAASGLPDSSAPHANFSTTRPVSEFLRSLRLPSWLAIAAMAIGVAFLSSLITAGWLSGRQSSLLADAADGSEAQTAVGAISATRNCRWTTHKGGYGDLVLKGQRLALQQGVAEITFNSGARLLLEGPAVVDITSEGGVDLRSGRLAVETPRDIESLPIRSGRISLAHSGASYGLIAESSGAGEVHVFKGVVLASLLDDLGDSIHSCQLASGRGGRLEPTARKIRPINAVGDLFVRSLSPGSGPRDGLFASEGFDYAAGPLGEQNGGFGWAGAWQDIETAESAAGGSTNLVEVRSLAWPGVPSIGNRAVQDGQENRIRRVLSMSVKGVFDTAGYVENRDAHRLIGEQGKTIYLAFLQRITKTNEVFYGVELNRGDGNGNRVLCIGNGVEESGYAVTSNYNGYINDTASPLGVENDQVNLFVVRIDFGEDDNDVATVYRNPQSLTEELACRPAAVLRGNFAFDRVSLGNFNGDKVHEVDDLRLGADFRVVTGQRSFIQGQLARAYEPARDTLLAGRQGRMTLASNAAQIDWWELGGTKR